MKKILLSFLAIFLLTPVTFADFSDVSENTIERTAIDWLENNGVINGYEDNTFRPNNYVNRAEFLKMLYLTLNFSKWESVPMIDNQTFSDLPEGEFWYQKYLSKAFKDEAVTGYPDGTVRPDQNINFAEASKIIANAFFNFDNSDVELVNGHCFLDRSYYEGEWFIDYMDYLDDYCILPPSLGDRSGRHPEMLVTREDMAVMLYRALSVHDNDTPNHTITTYTGNFFPEPNTLLAPNEFVYRDINRGRQIGDFRVYDIAPYSTKTINNGQVSAENLSMSFTGKADLSGEYYYNGYWLMIDLDEESLNKLPKQKIDTLNEDLLISNSAEFEETVKANGSTGEISFSIDYYEYKYWVEDGLRGGRITEIYSLN
ncbi:hypothetical protein GF354_03825 [Candidatus Peregrinibacteria bacterium]|nr:hypothetical protein [Candidatus Peregrinibacteria bacterium]